MSKTIALFIARSTERHFILLQYQDLPLHRLDVEALVLPGTMDSPATTATLAALGLADDARVRACWSQYDADGLTHFALPGAFELTKLHFLVFTRPLDAGDADGPPVDARTRAVLRQLRAWQVVNVGFALLDHRVGHESASAKATMAAMDELVEQGEELSVCRALIGGPGVTEALLRAAAE